MGEPIKVVVTADTQQAAAALEAFVKNSGSGLSSLAAEGAKSGEELQKLRELSILTRESFHSLETGALLLGGTRMPILGESFMAARLSMNLSRTAAMLFGVSLTELSALVAPLIPVALAGASAWRAWQASAQEADAEGRLFAQTQSLIARNQEALTTALEKGFISKDDFIYIDKLLNIGSESSLAAAVRKLSELGISATQMASFEKLQALENKMSDNTLSHYDQERAKAKDVFDERMAQIAKLAAASVQAENDRPHAEQMAEAEYNAKTAEITKQEQAANESKLVKQIDDDLFFYQQSLADKRKLTANDEFNFRVDEFKKAKQAGMVSEQQFTDFVIAQEKTRVASNEKITEKEIKNDEQLLQLKQEIARTDAEVQLKKIRDNPFLNDTQKAQQSVPAIQGLLNQDDASIAAQKNISTSSKDPTARALALKQINDLTLQQIDLQHQLEEAQGENSVGFQFGKALAQLQSMNNVAKELAATFEGVVNTSIRSVGTNLTGVIMGTETWHQALHNIYNTIVSDILNSFIQMGVRWALMEAMQTAATQLGTAMRTALHLQANATTTTSTAAAATTQVGAHAAVAGAGAASSQASIPYVGPILAIAAMAAIFAAVMELAHGFEEGGYTGNGGSSEVAGVVHKGEYVFSQAAVNRIGLDNLHVMQNGGMPEIMEQAGGSSPGERGGTSGGGSKNNVTFYAHTDLDKIRDHMERSDDHEKWFVDMMGQHIHKFR